FTSGAEATMRARAFLLAGWSGLTLGCGDRPAPAHPGAVIVRDSLGIRIVEHPAGYEDGLPVWDARGEPVVDIGGGDEGGQDLHLVRGAVRLGDRRIVVANGGSGELRVFDSTGRYLRAIGKQGQGPGEFASLGTVSRIPGDTLVALDFQLRRFSLFAPSGDFVSSTSSMVRSEHGRVAASMRLLDGRLVGTEGSFGDMKETSGPVRRVPMAVVVLQTGAEGFDTIAVVPGPEVYPALGREAGQEFPTVKGLEFGREAVIATDGRQIFVGSNEPVGIRVYQADGRLVRIIRSATPAEPVTEAHRAQRIRESLARLERQRAPEQLKAQWRKNQEDHRFAETFPFYERLLIGTDGSLWVELARRTEDEGRRYVVYDTSGTAIATVRCPDRVRPYEVGPIEILGLWRDPEEVNHVRAYKVSSER
ncbi:MAG TPA: 6-bladed beta-propeller, partial [Gemmatimonadales bacterium]|nr:6-bladed beta-propeller [Gemmatimonadales bacterium]